MLLILCALTTILSCVLLNPCGLMLTANSMSRDLRIISTTANPLSKHLVAPLNGLLAAQLLVSLLLNCALLLVF
jgi:hypothetical protein